MFAEDAGTVFAGCPDVMVLSGCLSHRPDAAQVIVVSRLGPAEDTKSEYLLLWRATSIAGDRMGCAGGDPRNTAMPP